MSATQPSEEQREHGPAPPAEVSRATLQPPSRPVRLLLNLLGWLSVGLAILGVPLPILPTTPFLILAAACFVRSSPTAHARLVAHPRFGPLIAQWQTRRTIPVWAKRRALILIFVTFSFSIAVLDSTALRIMQVVIGTSVGVFVARLRTEPPV